MDFPFYDSIPNDSSDDLPYDKKSVVVEDIDFVLYRWLIQRMHPLLWATYRPAYSPSREQLQKGLEGKTRSKGGTNKFNPFWIAKCRQLTERLYLCSGLAKGLFWADLDAHLWWQSLIDAEWAAYFVQAEFIRQGYRFQPIRYPSSYQGFHCVLPVSFDGMRLDAVSHVYNQFQLGLRRLLHWRGSPVASTSEVRGHPLRVEDGNLYSGKMCRLPLEQDWGLTVIYDVMKMPEISIRVIQKVAEAMLATYPAVQLPANPTPSSLPPHSPNISPHPVTLQSGNKPIGPVEPDSRKRQHEALMELSRQLKRVPSETEALDFIQQNNLFTPPWHRNQAKRTQRVCDILKFIAKTFDPAKCSSGNWIESVSCRLNETREYAQRYFTEAKMREAAAVFLAIADYCLIRNPNSNGTVPRDGFETLWKRLFAEGLTRVRWNRHRWKMMRETFEKMTVIIVGKDWGPKKAKRWEVGPNWPF